MVVIREVGVGFGYSFVVGSDRGEFDLVLGLCFGLQCEG